MIARRSDKLSARAHTNTTLLRVVLSGGHWIAANFENEEKRIAGSICRRANLKEKRETDDTDDAGADEDANETRTLWHKINSSTC